MDRWEPCPYGCATDVYVDPLTSDGVCESCDQICTFDPDDTEDS